jgi:hypothetical protein
VKRVTVRMMLWVSIFAPIVVSGEYLYFRIVAPAMDSPRIPAPFVGPDIIVVQPTVVATHIETETAVPEIPETQRRTTAPGKHRAPEPETPQPTGTRSIAPAEPAPSLPSTPTITVTPPSVVTTVAPEPTPVPTTPSRAAPAPVTSSRTPIYDTLRSETLATSPSLESVIPE